MLLLYGLVSQEYCLLGSAEWEVDGSLTWVKGNADGNYYYITNYDTAVWGQLKTEIEKDGNGALNNTNDRTSLIYDAFRLAELVMFIIFVTFFSVGLARDLLLTNL